MYLHISETGLTRGPPRLQVQHRGTQACGWPAQPRTGASLGRLHNCHRHAGAGPCAALLVYAKAVTALAVGLAGIAVTRELLAMMVLWACRVAFARYLLTVSCGFGGRTQTASGCTAFGIGVALGWRRHGSRLRSTGGWKADCANRATGAVLVVATAVTVWRFAGQHRVGAAFAGW